MCHWLVAHQLSHCATAACQSEKQNNRERFLTWLKFCWEWAALFLCQELSPQAFATTVKLQIVFHINECWNFVSLFFSCAALEFDFLVAQGKLVKLIFKSKHRIHCLYEVLFCLYKESPIFFGRKITVTVPCLYIYLFALSCSSWQCLQLSWNWSVS